MGRLPFDDHSINPPHGKEWDVRDTVGAWEGNGRRKEKGIVAEA